MTREAKHVAAFLFAVALFTFWLTAALSGWTWALWSPVVAWSIRVVIRARFVLQVKED